MNNNPVRYTDPTGHKICARGNDGGCDKKEELWNYAFDIVEKFGGKNDLKAVTKIVNKAASLYKTFDKLIPALSGVFLGVEESNPATIWHAAHTDACAAVGRAVTDCGTNRNTGAFTDTGFHPDFRDTFSQPFHFWAYLATAANTDGAGGPGSYIPGRIIGNVANAYHEIIQPDGAGATWQDYALARAGMNIGTLINLGVISPNQLANTIEDYIGVGGPGAFYVDPLIAIAPLQGN